MWSQTGLPALTKAGRQSGWEVWVEGLDIEFINDKQIFATEQGSILRPKTCRTKAIPVRPCVPGGAALGAPWLLLGDRLAQMPTKLSNLKQHCEVRPVPKLKHRRHSICGRVQPGSPPFWRWAAATQIAHHTARRSKTPTFVTKHWSVAEWESASLESRGAKCQAC